VKPYPGGTVKVKHEEKVKHSPEDALLLGDSSWSPTEPSLKYGWLDKNGKRARGGEVPVSAVPQAVLFAARKQYLDHKQIATIIKGLADILAKAK
jgi:hypothetical protein